MSIGENIANLRKEKNLTQEELANILSVSAKTISSYETNRSLPNIEILIVMTEVFDTKIENILGLENKEKIKIINKEYEKKNFKDFLIKVLLLSSVVIVPILFFWYVGYISMASIFAQIYTNNSIENVDSLVNAAQVSLRVFNSFFIEYIIYLIIIFINFILYKKKKKIILFIINGIIFSVFVIEFLVYSIQNGFPTMVDPYIFLLASIIGLVLGFRLKKIKNCNISTKKGL